MPSVRCSSRSSSLVGKFLADDTRLLLAAVGDALGTENTLTVFCADLYGVLNGSGAFGVS